MKDHLTPSETTHLDLLPQTWECVQLLLQLLKRKVNERRGMSGGMFEDEEVEIQQEMEALERWLEMRIEFENSATQDNAKSACVATRSEMGEVAENGTTMPPSVWGLQPPESSFETVDWQNSIESANLMV